jgi:hypothetical protein
MTTPTSNHDDDSELSETLRRDAARMQEPEFDAALHDATMRCVRASRDTGATHPRLRRIPILLAGAALLLVIVGIFTRRESSRVQPDVAAAIASTQNTIGRLSIEPASSLPSWMSPTASLLDQPRFHQ